MTTSSTYRKAFLFIALSFISSFFFAASAQSTSLKSRVAVVTSESKTNIWVSDFPKQTSIVISDNEDNLISIISTNDFGAAFLSLPTSIKTTVIAKTLDGEVIASNKAVLKENKEQQTAVSEKTGDQTKA